jgi:uncharacterized phage protein (TIGR01671 family)
MREFLFRGKRVDNGEQVEGFLVICDQRYFILPVEKIDAMCFDWLKKGEYIFGKFVEVVPNTVGQFTGLTDVNGKKIFEGDILSVLVNEMAYPEEGSFEEDVLGRRKIPTGNKIRTVWTVEHRIRNSSGSGFFVFGKDRRFSRIITGNTIYNAKAEVIGNIHDNPELLEG